MNKVCAHDRPLTSYIPYTMLYSINGSIMTLELLNKVLVIFITLDHVLINYSSEPSVVETCIVTLLNNVNRHLLYSLGFARN